jgi:7,8-didemethyl-8-hydroxy-5-deazariboflavin synthase CofH subunit
MMTEPPFSMTTRTNANSSAPVLQAPAEQAPGLQSFPRLHWDDIAPQLSTAVRAILEPILETGDAADASRGDLCRLAYATGSDLAGVLVAANLLRQKLAGDTITYVINRNINFTNICFVGCKFCAFCCGPKDPEAYLMPPEEVAEKAVEASALNATEVCIQGGLPRNLPPFYYRDTLRAIKKAVPAMHTHAFSPMEILYGVELTGMPLRDYLLMLKDAGLDSIPGTAAEILNDELRSVLSRHKLSARQWREVITTAHRCGIPTTSTILYGHRETPEHWVDQLLLFREIQNQAGGFTEFVPLGFIHQNTRLYQQGLARPGATLAEHLLVHALARIALAGSIRNIQVSWVKLSRETAQLCLQAGGNDYGGTLMEENISRLAGAEADQYMAPEQFHERIRELGRIPAERNTLYTKLHFAGANGELREGAKA